MFYEMTVQVRVSSMIEGQKWYKTLLNRKPDFVPHEGFAEWELFPGCWLQVAEGTPSEGSGPIRLGVKDINVERDRLVSELGIERFEINGRKEVPVKWATFSDPWGNMIGFFEYVNREEMEEKISRLN
ncbi:VOC family protein [Cytobacillus suaedae]|nr:VOC family protein [Cytobacillus suaedae]